MNTMSLSKWMLFASTFFVTFSGFSQNKQFRIIGQVVNGNDGLPLQMAAVSILDVEKNLVTGSLTNNKGQFSISVTKGEYYVSVTFVGCKPYKSELISLKDEPVVNLRTIALESDGELEAVEIEAERPFMVNSIDRKTYDVEALEVTDGGTVNEVLQVIPSVDVDIDGVVSLRGNSNVVVLIDGKPSGMSAEDAASYFQTLPAGAIEKIEVITNPSAKFDPDGMMGMINIVSKVNKFDGISGNVKVSVGNGPNLNTSGMLSIKKGKWNAMANLGYNTRNGYAIGDTYREVAEDEIPVLLQTNDGARITSGFNGRLSATYTFNKRNNIRFNGSYGRRHFEREESILYEYQNLERNFLNALGRESNGLGNMNMIRAGVDFTHKFKQDGRQLSLGINESIFDGTFGGDYIEFPVDEDLVADKSQILLDQRQLSPNLRYTTTIQADYVHPLKKNNAIEAGYKSIFTTGDSRISSEVFDEESEQWLNEENITNDFVLQEQIHSVYGIYKQSIKKFGYQLGLRAEQAFTDAELITTNETFYNEYFSLFPSLHLSYWLPKTQQLKASYSRRINRPRGRQLNPFADYSDPQNIRKGNPFLYPEYINSIEAEYQKIFQKQTITAGVYFKQVENMISRIKTVEDAVSTVSFENAGTAIQYGIEGSWNANVKKWWRITASLNAFNMQINDVESDLSSEGYTLNSKLLTSFTLPREYSLQLSAQYNTPKVVPQGQVSGQFFLDASLNKKVLKNKATISIRGTDLFNTRSYNFVTEGTNFYQESYRKRQSRFVFVGFSYNFGQFKERSFKGSRSRDGGGTDGETLEID